MVKKEMIYEGKAKKVYSTDDPDLVIVSYKDDATAFNGEKKGAIVGKGVVNNRMSNHIFKILERNGIRTHYVDEIGERETVVKSVEIIPIEVIVRNIAAGGLCKKYGIPEGSVLNEPIIEYSLKSDELGDPLMNTSHALAMKLATADEINVIRDMTKKINSILIEFFLTVDITLVDFKLEFGRYHDDIILADEISPDTCRLWDVHTKKKLDKDRFRKDLGEVEEAYLEVFKRLGL